MLLFANATKSNKLKITTENQHVAKRASRLLKTLFGFDFDKKIAPATSMKKYSLLVEHADRLAVIFDAIGIFAVLLGL